MRRHDGFQPFSFFAAFSTVVLFTLLYSVAVRAGVIVAPPGPGPGPGDGCPGPDGHLGFHDPSAVLDVGVESQAVAVADLDGDGTQDIVAADTVGDRIRIRFGSGDGSFWGTHTWTMGDGPTDVDVGDFNGDGYEDILATNVHADRVRIRWGAAHEPWSDWSWWATGDGPIRVAVGDVNDDGLDDFVTTNVYGSNSITVRRRLAAGGFDTQTYGAPEAASDIQLVDLDDDGDLDMAYPSDIHHARVAVRLNDGDGTFGGAVLSGMASAFDVSFHALTFGDYDEDGHVDVIAARNTHSLVRALGNGDGTFSSPVAAPTGNNPIHVITDDFNRDGNLDIVVSHFFGGLNLSLYLGDGDGNMNGPVDLGVNYPAGTLFDVAAADFNGDGFQDIVYTDYQEAFLMLSDSPCPEPSLPCRGAAGSLAFEGDPESVLEVGTESQAIAAADLDGDGDQDIVAADTVGDRIRIRFGDGDGTFSGTQTWAMGDGPTDVEVGDFNDDGYQDIIATNFHTDRVRIRWGAASQPWLNWSWWGTGNGPMRVAVGDVNGDGRDDFVTTNVLGGNSITVRRRLAAGGFDSQSYPAPEAAADIALVDVDADGDLDMVYPSEIHNARLAVRRNSGTGAFGAALLSDMGSGFSDNITSLTFGDYNEDGKVDVIATRNTHSLVRALGNGNGTFSSPVAAPTGNNPWHLVTADFNLDGHLDIAVTHFASGQGISLYLGQGDGNMVGPQNLGVDLPTGALFDLAVADFDEDGFQDIAFTGYQDAFLLLSDSPCDDVTPPRIESYRRGDANGDGSVDLADAVSTLGCLFLGARCSQCPDAADTNDDGQVDLGDVVSTLTYLFQDPTPPPAPGPRSCGRDATPDRLSRCVYDACSSVGVLR